MILTDKMREALGILADGPAAQGKITSTEFRVIAHPTMTRLALHHLAEPTGAEDFFHRPLWQITADGRTVLEAVAAMAAATTPTPEGDPTP